MRVFVFCTLIPCTLNLKNLISCTVNKFGGKNKSNTMLAFFGEKENSKFDNKYIVIAMLDLK